MLSPLVSQGSIVPPRFCNSIMLDAGGMRFFEGGTFPRRRLRMPRDGSFFSG